MLTNQENSPSAEQAIRFASELSIPHPPLPHPGYHFLTRANDIIVALVLLVLNWPLMLLAALMIKLNSPGQVLFRHRRLGMFGRHFQCYKFRTMVADAPKRREEVKELLNISGPRVKPKSDPRIIRVGKLLRRFSIDEFPQIINVLHGHMSLVGPRPLPIEELEDCTPEQLQRLAVKPGLTCIWQISGRSEIGFEEQMKMDLEYIEKRSLWHDFKILAMTPWVVLNGIGAY